MLTRIVTGFEVLAVGSGMFKATPYGEAMVCQQIGSETGSLSVLAAETELPPVEERPFVQLSYDEVDGQELDRILGSDICAANGAVGFPGPLAPAKPTPQILLFELGALARRLRAMDPQLTEEFDSHGTDAIMGSREATATEYLVLGLLHCIAWCEANRAALMISW
jgi:hypothetical protein